MTLMEMIELMRSAIKEGHPPHVLREITNMMENKIAEGLEEYEHMHLKDYIEFKRVTEGMTKQELAERASIKPSQLSQILGGHKQNLSLKIMKQIVDATGGVVNQVDDFIFPVPDKKTDD